MCQFYKLKKNSQKHCGLCDEGNTNYRTFDLKYYHSNCLEAYRKQCIEYCLCCFDCGLQFPIEIKFNKDVQNTSTCNNN
jgi:hypothetical protein